MIPIIAYLPWILLSHGALLTICGKYRASGIVSLVAIAIAILT
jgi:hypothetical protein